MLLSCYFDRERNNKSEIIASRKRENGLNNKSEGDQRKKQEAKWINSGVAFVFVAI